MPWVQNHHSATFYGVRLTLKKGGNWKVTGPSPLSGLKIEEGGALQGKVGIDGKAVTPVAGLAYAGRIAVTPL